MLSGVITAVTKAPELFGFDPTIDGPGGLYPDIASRLLKQGHFAKLPFIAGTNLDEGKKFLIDNRVWSVDEPLIGTSFISITSLSTADIRASIIANYSPPLVNPVILQQSVDKLLQLYPDDPAVGSPFNTGSQTFGLPSNFKRAAALS